MSKHRRAAKVDDNQGEIVDALRKIPGVTVQTGMDDLLVGYNQKNYWFEVKQTPKSTVKPSQYTILKEWNGHYMFAFTVDDILEDIGVKPRTYERIVFTSVWHALIQDDQTPAKANKWAERAVTRYKQGQMESVQQLIVDMIEEGKR